LIQIVVIIQLIINIISIKIIVQILVQLILFRIVIIMIIKKIIPNNVVLEITDKDNKIIKINFHNRNRKELYDGNIVYIPILKRYYRVK
jgi:hypothetical protein